MLTLKNQLKFALLIPLINVIADSTHGYVQWGIFSPGYLRTILNMFFILSFFNVYYLKTKINKIIVITLLYFFILSLFSSDITYSLSVFLKYFMASMMFPIGYFYFDTYSKYYRLLKVLSWTLGFYVFFLILANIFGFGSSDYLEDSVYFGAGRVNATKAMMILLFPVFLLIRIEKSKKSRIFYLTIFITALAFIFLGVKRSALLGIIIGFPLYFYLTPYKSKSLLYIFSIFLLMLLASPLYFDDAISRIEVRQEQGRFDINQAEEEEARYIEITKVIDAFIDGNLSYKLFGAEIFNSPHFFKTVRMLHTDYATIFQGTGLVGFFLFLYLYFLIFKQILFFRRIIITPDLQNILAIMLAVEMALLITGISGSVTEIGLRSIVFIFLGGSFSFVESEINRRNQLQ